jgi:hypothetical protein
MIVVFRYPIEVTKKCIIQLFLKNFVDGRKYIKHRKKWVGEIRRVISLPIVPLVVDVS